MVFHKDILAGALFALLGLVACVLSAGYRIGTAGQMGPGYVPLMIGVGMTILGVVIAATRIAQIVREPARPVFDDAPWSPRPLLCVLIGILLFGVLIKPTGLIFSSVILLGCGSFAVKGQRLLEFIVLTSVLIAAVALVFVYCVGVRIDLLPRLAVFSWS